eukprot:1429912-Amphidinium_carterae.1
MLALGPYILGYRRPKLSCCEKSEDPRTARYIKPFYQMSCLYVRSLDSKAGGAGFNASQLAFCSKDAPGKEAKSNGKDALPRQVGWHPRLHPLMTSLASVLWPKQGCGSWSQ